ncbi:hypothetical protein H257_18150 [Aphanomyces astaci]|uniref:DDE Tnp4 domain-containing protein n=1 Tax=Aphanomyces astaci TaxID=112090 RepID=W4FED2_APHAT|nr:hypothetical protein H257_18150 [Aphanomyces astaci]ETV65063.1 hypothetical protein H257_18150 [Aphanomyces astaci]|eukprot:XP_009845462.1 hypothetical protein H257_18150 [Aphanomyces astaci]
MVLTHNDLALVFTLAKTKRQRRFVAALALSLVVERPLIPDIRFNIDLMSDANAVLEFRFDVGGVQRVAFLLGLPAVVITPNRNRVVRDEAMCIVLSRLAFPTRFFDMSKTRWNKLLYFNYKLVSRNIDDYCAAIARKGSPSQNVFGFIDGTKVQVCRISATMDGNNMQKEVYSGHKRVHCLNYQAVTAPDGICVHFFGPAEGRRHDTTMLRYSGLLDYLEAHSGLFWRKCIYGDPAYGVFKFLLSGYKGNGLSNAQRDFNKWMSRVRQSVEWNFKVMKTLWAFITFKGLSKIRLSPVAKVVCVAMLLTNCHCCYFGGNQISKFFKLDPPSLESYLDTLDIIDV